MGKSFIRDIDRGYAKIKQELAKLRKQEVAVGLQAGDMAADGEMTIARLGAIHEFGCTIEQGERTQTIYHKLNKSGTRFLRKGRFVKAIKSNFARDVSVGAHTINIPERSFLRSTFDEKNREWHAKAEKQVQMVATGKKDAATALDVLGHMVQGDIQRKIIDGPFTPNAPSTIRWKKSARPLIGKTGRMRSSIRYVIRGRGEGKNK